MMMMMMMMMMMTTTTTTTTTTFLLLLLLLLLLCEIKTIVRYYCYSCHHYYQPYKALLLFWMTLLRLLAEPSHLHLESVGYFGKVQKHPSRKV